MLGYLEAKSSIKGADFRLASTKAKVNDLSTLKKCTQMHQMNVSCVKEEHKIVSIYISNALLLALYGSLKGQHQWRPSTR